MKTRTFTIVLGVCFGLGSLFAARPVRAEGQVEVYMQVKAPDQKDPKLKGKAPQIEATIVDGAKL